MPACKGCTRTYKAVNKKGFCAECAGEVVSFESPYVKVVADAKSGQIKRIERKKPEERVA